MVRELLAACYIMYMEHRRHQTAFTKPELKRLFSVKRSLANLALEGSSLLCVYAKELLVLNIATL